MESSIKIDSICIDLANSSERIDEHKCDHFSIRGYVAETRKKDWKSCLPFCSDGVSVKYEELACVLPPLHVPEFRFWRCQNCLREIGGKGTAIDHEEVFKHCFTGFASNTVCSHVPTLSDAAKLSDFQQAAKQDICQPKKIDANASGYLNNTTEYQPLSCTGKKEKKAELACCPAVDKDLESEVMNHNANILTGDMPQVVSSLVQKTCHTNEKVSKPSCGCYKVLDAELTQNNNRIANNVAKTCERIIENSLVSQHKELKGCKALKEFSNANEALGANKDFVSGCPSLELDECDYLSSESAEIMIGANIQNETSSGLHRRKTRKVRLLTELLCKGDGDTVYARTGSSLPDAMPDLSKEVDKCPIAQETVATQGEVKRGLSSNKKRKSSDDEGLRALEVGFTNKTGKEVRVLRRDGEAPDAIKNSGLKRDESAKPEFQNVLTSHWTKHKINKNPVPGKKKKRKTIISDEHLPLEPSLSNMPIEIADKDGDGSKNDVADGRQVKPADNAFTESEIALFPLPAQKMDGEACKGKMPQSSDCHVSLFPPNHSMIREGPIIQNAEAKQMGPAILPFHSTEETSLEKGLNLSLSSYTDTQRCKNNYIPQAEDSRISSLTWQETISQDQAAIKAADARFIGNYSFNGKSAQDMLFVKGLNIDASRERPLARMLFHNDKQNHASQFEIGGCSLMQQKNVCCTRKNERTVGLQEHSEVSWKDAGQRADKASDLGGLDDIPMDIVELMAKNQYERRLTDAQYSKLQLDIGNNNGSCQAENFSRVYGHPELSLFQQNSTQKLDFWAKTGKNVSETEQKLVDYFAQADRNQFNMNQLEKTQTTMELGAFLQGVRQPSVRLQHSASVPSKHDNTQTCQWPGDILGEKSSYTSLQTPAPCDTCQTIPQQSRTANHLWSSMMPSHLPLAYSIPPKCSSLPINLEVLPRSSGSACKESVNRTPDMRFLNQNATNLAKQTGTFGSEIVRHRLSEYPFSCKHKGIELNQKPAVSGDLYSNETIPAMHLLSLMDARLRSSAPIMGVTTNSLKRPPLTHDHNPKECSRLDLGAHKLTGTMKHIPYDYRGKNQLVENCCEHIPVIQRPVGTSASSLRHNKNLKKATDFSGQVLQEKERKGFDSRAQNKGGAIQKPVSTSGAFGQSRGSIPVHNFSLPFGASDPGVFPLPFHSLGNSTKQKLESCSTTKAILPHRSSSRTEICSLNRNPADFCIPEGNVYMIAGEELKSRNFLPSANISRLTKLDGRKRQRKLPTLKEHRRQPVS